MDKNITPTIKDVAKAANVSRTTVSRYLNGKYEYMSLETKEKIEDVISRLEYRPSNIARSLKTKNSMIIGCIIADIGSPFSSILVKGINYVCNREGYNVLFANTDNDPVNEKNSIESLLDSKVDGLIINTTGNNDDYFLNLMKRGIKIVLADRCLRKRNLIDTVTTNNYQATYKCIEFLYQQGYKKVGFFTQDMTANSSRYLRHDGYMDAMKDFFQTDGNEYTYIVDTDNMEDCTNKINEFINKGGDDAKVIFTVNGVTMLNVLQGMKRLNINISNSLGICGFDDWGWASLISPGITTLTQDSYNCGVKSAELLISKIRNNTICEPKYIELDAELVKRGSTNPNIK